MAAEGGAVEGDAGETGAAAVRRRFIARLQADGLQRPKNVTPEAHAAMLDRLVSKLAYLDGALLDVLAEVVLTLAEGRARNLWPCFATIWAQAVRLRLPPDDERHIMTTWLGSIEGPHARREGHLVELHAWLRRHGRPPSNYDLTQIRAVADENRRRMARVAERVAAGMASADDLAWRNWYERALSGCEALVAAGEAKRGGGA